MTVRFVGKGGSDASNGLTWATRKLTLNGAEDTPVVAGDVVYVGAGTYRELLTVDVSGGNVYSTGTVSVINGSAVVTGLGTSFLANVAANYIFHSTVLARGTDGVTVGLTATSHTFTSAAGNFQTGHVGHTIRINTIGAFIITAVASLTSITVAKPDNSSFLMGAGITLTYDVGPESPYDILSVDSDTQITLAKAWSGASFTGLAYLTYNPIHYIGDYRGTNTDGVGGVVRVTGSDNDQAATRANCIAATSKSYRIFQGFQFDTATSILISSTSSTNWVVQLCVFQGANSGAQAIDFAGASQASNVVQLCIFWGVYISGASVRFTHSSAIDNTAQMMQNCICVGVGGVQATRVGGVTARNSLAIGATSGFRVVTALTVGQALTVNNCIIQSCTNGLQATTTAEFIDDYNTIYSNVTDRTNVLTGANSKVYPALFDPRPFFQLLLAGAGPYNATQLVTPFDLASFSQLINLAGFNPSATDMRGTAIQNTRREWGALEYDSTLSIKARQASSTDGGGMAA